MKFRVGDRVVYRAVDSGNTDLDGWAGTVIYVDGTQAPYTVRFDEYYHGGITDERCPPRGGVRRAAAGGDDWFCREENLSPLGVRRKVRRGGGRPKGTAARERSEGEDAEGEEAEGCADVEGHTKKQEEKDMARGIERHKWTAEEDAVIREMLEGGSSVVDICDRLGVDMVTMKNRLYALRKADPTFPRCMKRQGRSDVAAEGGSDVAACGNGDVAACGSGDVPTGTLGELEQALADTLADVTRERDEALAELDSAKKKLLDAEEDQDELRRELKSAKDALQRAAHGTPVQDRERRLGTENAPLAETSPRVAELTEENAKLAETRVRLQTRLDEAHKSLAEREEEVRELARQLAEARCEVEALVEEKECYSEEFADGVAYYKRQAEEMEKIVSAQVDEMEKVRCENRRLAAEVCEVNRIVVGLVARYVLDHTKEVGA